ncbi:LysM peptidoglycan-binding domain-containing protein [Fontimonas sp. SYSU GA230001]|uniref:LysM peptidoglycan-binding domain-containing protein n=1 Tax=Fontimonas sp. SYSU GA230001 TaxID=3142450 RepID=UPI0032B46BCF
MNTPVRLFALCAASIALCSACGLHRIPPKPRTPAPTSAPAAVRDTVPAPAATAAPPGLPATSSAATRARADTDAALRAELELQKAQTYTGLSDTQLDRLRAAEVALAAGDPGQALVLLHALNAELAQATQRYVVAAGDSLWIISGRPEIYGNPYLWPLIWDANLDTLKDPNLLRTGQRLRIRTNPTIDEVVQAVERARGFRSAKVRIGEVREAAP